MNTCQSSIRRGIVQTARPFSARLLLTPSTLIPPTRYVIRRPFVYSVRNALPSLPVGWRWVGLLLLSWLGAMPSLRAQSSCSPSYTTPGSYTYTVSAAGPFSVTLTTKGGDGGSTDDYNGGSGAMMSLPVTLQAGDQLISLVGEAGRTDGRRAGGGGGTAVVLRRGNTTTLLMASGGGGGAAFYRGNPAGGGGQGLGRSTGGAGGNGDNDRGGGGGGGGLDGAGTAGAGFRSGGGGGQASLMGISPGGTELFGSGNGGSGFGGGGAGYTYGNNGGGGGGYGGGDGGGDNRGGQGGYSFGTGTITPGTAGGGQGQHGSVSIRFANSTATASITGGNTTVCTGQSTNVTGTVNASGTWTITLSNGSTATGTGSTFSIPVTPTASTTYSIQCLFDANGVAQAGNISGSRVVTLNSPVGITAQPPTQSAICAGGAVTAAVSVSGTGPLTYQWYKNGALLSPAQSTASLSLPSATAADAGSYSVVATGACNSLTSNAFSLTVNSPLAITQQPAASSAVCAGISVSVPVSVTGTGPFTYRWYKDGAELTGNTSATTAALSIPSATVADAGSYSVVVTGACNSLTSTAFSLTVNSPIGITAQPATQSVVCAGGAVTVAVSVSVTGTGPLTYQWYRNGAIVTGNTSATTAALSIPSATVADGGSYSVVMTGVCNSLTSTVFSLTVNTPVGITAQPATQSVVCAGGAVTVAVSASGTGPLTYQWYKDATPLSPAQNTASLNLTNVQSADAGSYSVVVTGVCNSVTSTVFSLTVNALPAPPTLSANSRTLYASALPLSLTPFVVATANTLSFSGLSGALPNPPTVNISQAGQQVYRVSQTNTNGCVSGATSFTLTVLPVSPVSQTVCRSSRVELVAGAFGSRYEWYRNGQSAPFKLTEIASIQRGTATSSLTLVSVQTPASYYCKVFSADGGFVFTGPFLVAINYGCIAPGARQGAGADVAGAVAEGGLQVLVRPNPVVGDRLRAVVSGAEGQSLRVSLIDSRGRSVGHQEWSSAGASAVVDWDMSQRPAGVYVLRAVSGSSVGVVRVVKAE